MENLTVNGLTFSANPDGSYTCEDLRRLPETFAERFTPAEVSAAIDARLADIRDRVFLAFETPEECDAEKGDAEAAARRKQAGLEIFDREVAKIGTAHRTLFQQLLFWYSDWWYIHPMHAAIRYRAFNMINDYVTEHLPSLILGILPDSLRNTVRGMELINVAVGYGHFALLFCKYNSGLRRIITDTQLFELNGVSGYVYLDVTPDGKPITRSVCNKGGGRAFFDGVRLMAHRRFETCAPATVMLNGNGYKVNSTRCTIVNGKLFPLIDVDDKVAHTTGAFLGWVDFTAKDQVEATALAQQSGARMRLDGDKVFLDGQELRPLGTFLPSRITLQDNGFAGYEWSTFQPVTSPRFTTVMVVDDNSEWIAKVRDAFSGPLTLTECLTTDATVARDAILATNPEAVLLDMHLTSDERFEGLWVANQLAKSGFGGAILITSSYPDEHLRAMQKLIQRETEAPGKNIDRVRECLMITEDAGH